MTFLTSNVPEHGNSLFPLILVGGLLPQIILYFYRPSTPSRFEHSMACFPSGTPCMVSYSHIHPKCFTNARLCYFIILIVTYGCKRHITSKYVFDFQFSFINKNSKLKLLYCILYKFILRKKKSKRFILFLVNFKPEA